MSRSLAVLIGVCKVSGLPKLSGVRAGLEGFEEWAQSQGFEPIRFDDLSGRPVKLGEIREAIQHNIKAGDVEKLFVYFTGHGIMRGVCDEYWLLSLAHSDETEAINAWRSQQMSFHCGFGHVAFFADACRTAASDAFTDVNGGSLFHKHSILRRGVEVDEFYATRYGYGAYEVEGKGLFSHYLISALRGHEPDAIRDVQGGRQPQAVLSYSLRPVLEGKVEAEASRRGLEQMPFSRPGSHWQPNVLSWLEPGQPPPVQPISPEGVTSPDMPGDAEADSEEMVAEALERRTDADLAQLTKEYRDAHDRRSHVNSEPVVVGARVTRTVGLPSTHRHMGSLMLRFGSRPQVRWAGVALLPGYSCTMAVRESAPGLGVDYVAYLPLDNRHNGGQPKEIDILVADTSAHFRLGFFDQASFDASDRVRSAVFEELNPTLSVITAYALSRAGQWERLRDLIRRFERSDQVVPFDLPLLADLPLSSVRAPVAPSFPMMTSGWALLEDLPAGRSVLEATRPHLRPSVWTTLKRPSSSVVRALAQPLEVALAASRGLCCVSRWSMVADKATVKPRRFGRSGSRL